MKHFKLSFKGYWRAEKRDYIPHITGIYLVYRCTYVRSNDSVALSELVYIGQSEDVNRRIQEHCVDPEFVGALHEGETLCFSIAEVNHFDLDIVENALIYAQKPRLNTEGVNHYSYEDVGFDIEGRCSLLTYTSFTITV